MYYLSNRRFKKISNQINSSLFDGFSFVKCITNPMNRNKEHFSSFPLTSKEVVPDVIVNSRIYDMPSHERKTIINNCFAKALGFDSFFDYKKNTKFLTDIKALTKIEKTDYYTLNSLDSVILDNINSAFGFKESPVSIFTGILNPVFIEKRKAFIMGDYKTSEDFEFLYPFVVNSKYFSFESNKASNDALKNRFYLREEPDMHFSDYLPFFLDKIENKEYSFFDKVYYLNDIFKIEKEINELSEESFLKLISKLEGSLSSEVIKAVYLLRKNPEDPYIKFLRKVEF